MEQSTRLRGGGDAPEYRRPTGAPSASRIRHSDPAAVARRLGGAVSWAGAATLEVRSWRLVAKTSDFDAWLIAWPGGTSADLHDHGGSRGALHVISGTLSEAVPLRDQQGSVSVARRDLDAGETVAFGAGHVHEVRNETADHALSLHVYSPPLTSMIYYERLGDRLIARQKGWAPSDDESQPLDAISLRLVAP